MRHHMFLLKELVKRDFQGRYAGSVLGFVWSFVQLHEAHWSSTMWPVAIHGLIAAYLLFDNDAKAFFERA